MIKTRRSFGQMFAAACMIFACSFGARADDHPSKVGIAVTAGVLNGVGLSVGIPVGNQFNLRAAGGGLKVSRTVSEGNDNGSSNNFDVSAKFLSYGLLADWHPFKGSFRLTGGAMRNGSEISANAVSNSGDYNVGNCTYTSSSSNPLKVGGSTNYRSMAPYLGVGWGGNMNSAPGFFATADLGALIVGSANILLSASGQAVTKSGPVTECGVPGVTVTDASTDPNVRNQLAKDQRKLNDTADRLQVFPMISFSLGWRF